jgi:hypothetical protein
VKKKQPSMKKLLEENKQLTSDVEVLTHELSAWIEAYDCLVDYNQSLKEEVELLTDATHAAFKVSGAPITDILNRLKLEWTREANKRCEDE